MFEPRKIQRRSARPSQPITTIKNPPSDERKRIEGRLSLDSFWTAIDAPRPRTPRRLKQAYPIAAPRAVDLVDGRVTSPATLAQGRGGLTSARADLV